MAINSVEQVNVTMPKQNNTPASAAAKNPGFLINIFQTGLFQQY
jgi:hypothetical protein